MSDLIRRQDAIERLREFSNDDMTSTEKAIGADYCVDLISTIPSAQPQLGTQMSLADCISRQQAIDALNEYFARIGKLKRRGLTKGEKAISLDTVGVIKTMPSAQPETNCSEFTNNSDTISRQAAIDEIDNANDGLVKDDYTHGVQSGMEKAKYVIEELPSAQPEIIRCKDCKHWDTSWQNDYAPNYHYCPLVDGTRRDDFYCADAERRTDEA